MWQKSVQCCREKSHRGMEMALVVLTCRLKRRIFQLITVVLIAVWVWHYLGGVSLRPTAVRPLRHTLPGPYTA